MPASTAKSEGNLSKVETFLQPDSSERITSTDRADDSESASGEEEGPVQRAPTSTHKAKVAADTDTDPEQYDQEPPSATESRSGSAPETPAEVYFVESMTKYKGQPYWSPKAEKQDTQDTSDSDDEDRSPSKEPAATFVHLRCLSRAHPGVSWRISVDTENIDSQVLPSAMTITAIHKLHSDSYNHGHRTTWSTMRSSMSDNMVKGDLGQSERIFRSHVTGIQDYILHWADHADDRVRSRRSLKAHEKTAVLTEEIRRGFDPTEGFIPDWDTVCQAVKAEAQRLASVGE